MSDQLLNSEYVQVFPFGKKRLHDRNARVLNEQNITNLVRMLTDKKSYVVSFDEENNVIEFVINGYLFKTDVSKLWTEFLTYNAVYACIDLATTDDNYSYLTGGDPVSVIMNGEGTSESPYELEDGTFTTVLHSTDQATYFKYTFDTKSTLTIYDNDSIEISGLEGIDLPEDDKIIVSGDPEDAVTFCIALEDNATYGDIRIDCGPNAGKFTGIRFVSEKPKEGFYLKLFDVKDSSLTVPVDSFLKFDEKSINKSNPVDSIKYVGGGDADYIASLLSSNTL